MSSFEDIRLNSIDIESSLDSYDKAISNRNGNINSDMLK